MFTILTARSLGVSRIVGIEPNENNARLAERLGVDEVVRFKPSGDWRSDPAVVEKVRRFGGGNGVDVALEMAGYNASVNNALQSVRMGGDVVLFGIKDGDFTIGNFEAIVDHGLSLHGVIGRRVFETWNISTNLLEARENRIQEKIFDVILNGGKDTVLDIENYDPDDFEKRITEHPKVLIKWS
jgi:threonine 3-dehydrogenase